MHLYRLFFVLSGLILLAACSQVGEPTATPELTATEPAAMLEIATVPAATIPPTKAPTAAPPTETPEPTVAVPTETPEPIESSISAEPQAIDTFGIVTLAEVISAEDGVVALLNDAGVLGWTPVTQGVNENVMVQVDAYEATESLIVGLYTGDQENFVLDSAEPILWEGVWVNTRIELTLGFSVSSIVVADQTLLEDGAVTLSALTLAENGWVAVYNDNGGEWGERIGLQWVEAGDYTDFQLPVYWQIGTPTLHVVLHRDTGREGRFDYPEDDLAMIVQSQPISASINVNFPPDIFVLSQPVISNTIIIERIVSDGQKWVTVSQQQREIELPGNVIGFALLQDGVNEQVEVELLPGYATSVLYLQLHDDDHDLGEFEFPAYDKPVLYFDQPRIFELDAEPGNYLITEDQVVDLTGDTATVEVLVVTADIPLWVVIRQDAEGELGEVLGYEWVAPGIGRNIQIEIDSASATPILHAVLHIDRETQQVFDFPDGTDFELQRRRAPINAPFTILNSE